MLISVLSPLCEMRPQNHLVSVPQPHTPQGRAAAASANCTPDKLLSMAAQLKGRKRCRPPLIKKAKADRVALRIGKDPNKLRHELRVRIETPDAKTRKRIVGRLHELAADREAAV